MIHRARIGRRSTIESTFYLKYDPIATISRIHITKDQISSPISIVQLHVILFLSV